MKNTKEDTPVKALTEGIYAWIDKNRDSFWFLSGINLLILLGMILIMRPVFETNDDGTIVEMVSGALSMRDAHIVYQNYLLGRLYISLYGITSKIPWYGILQYFFLWIAFSIITYVIVHKINNIAGITVSAVICFFFAYECYIKMQYTKTAGILAIAGVFLIFYAITSEKLSVALICVGMALSCIGSMYRFRQFLICVALMSGIGVFVLLQKNRDGKRIIAMLISTGAIILAAAALNAFDHYIYQSDSQWRDYLEFNELRTELLDYEFPEYEDYPEEYGQLGLTEDAYELWNHWNFADSEMFTVPVMRKLLALNPERMINEEVFSDFFDEFPRSFFESAVFYGFLIILLFWILGENYKQISKILALLYELLLFGGCYFYLYFTGRYGANRVDVALWLAVSLVVLWMTDSEIIQMSVRSGILLCLAILVLSQYTWYDHWRVNAAEEGKKEREVLELLHEDSGHLYVAKNKTIRYDRGYGPLDVMPVGIASNFSFFGGWETNTAVWNDKFERYGVKNLFRDCIDNDAVRLIDDEIDITMSYIHTYYDENAAAEQVDVFKGVPVYRIYSSE